MRWLSVRTSPRRGLFSRRKSRGCYGKVQISLFTPRSGGCAMFSCALARTVCTAHAATDIIAAVTFAHHRTPPHVPQVVWVPLAEKAWSGTYACLHSQLHLGRIFSWGGRRMDGSMDRWMDDWTDGPFPFIYGDARKSIQAGLYPISPSITGIVNKLQAF